jgi:hypothetical protein
MQKLGLRLESKLKIHTKESLWFWSGNIHEAIKSRHSIIIFILSIKLDMLVHYVRARVHTETKEDNYSLCYLSCHSQADFL